MQDMDVIIIGAGAAGLMCAIEAGKRGRTVLVIDHASKPAEKIRISGGGRCNFTNLNSSPKSFLGQNPRFCISALKRFTQQDFLALVDSFGISWHEKTLGQLFCDDKSKQIIEMLLSLCEQANVKIALETKVEHTLKEEHGFRISTSKGPVRCQSLVIATGGPSIPKMGATGFGYELAKKFGIPVVSPLPALVPLTFGDDMKHKCSHLAGVSVDALVSYGKISFREGLLFTHRGLSGPSILQISSYWREGTEIKINLLPTDNVFELLKEQRAQQPRREIQTALCDVLPKRLVNLICDELSLKGRLADHSDKVLRKLSERVHNWQIKPVGTEGYRTAEVTRGGVDTNALSSKTMESKDVGGLYFIGEVVDVTGHLGGFNFQWAWSSGYTAGQFV
ncbi:BaiN/RdsA family NAD(P)/FAD-dependent oxidoreductase [Flexibacterium corallicola]|uniref:NAD(P)/FAD-dependent oxidoreductase n=1 Tax=Flexibacterium corallicola TaxID=3037259 RepID=UPI00286F176E|nr:NAD(P)/FAD-dependent oxidoreductase [Pseudovibrio sp. M1P-2-3]